MQLFRKWTLVLIQWFALVVFFFGLENITFGSSNQKLSQYIAFELYDSELRKSLLHFQKEVLAMGGFASMDEATLVRETLKHVGKVASNIEHEFDSEEELKVLQNLVKQAEIKRIMKIVIETCSRVLFQVPMSELVGINVVTSWLEENQDIEANEFEKYLIDLIWLEKFNKISRNPSEFKKYLYTAFAKELREKMNSRDIESAKLMLAANSSMFERLTRCTVTTEE